MKMSSSGGSPKILGNCWHMIANIKECLYTTCLDIEKYFEKLDKRKEGLVTDVEFVNVLTLAFEDILGLTNDQALELANCFREIDGRIRYSEFLHAIDLTKDRIQYPDLVTGMEWVSLVDSNYLSLSDMKVFEELLDEIAGRICIQKILLKGLVRDYELITKNHGLMTITQFGTLLNTLKVRCDKNEFCLLVKKYAHHNYTVNYLAFLKDVEKRILRLQEQGRIRKYFGVDMRHLIEIKPEREKILGDPKHDSFQEEPEFHPSAQQKSFNEDIDEILRQIQYFFNTEKVNTATFFNVFDPLKSGYVTEHQFRRVLAVFGIDETGPAVRFIIKGPEMVTLIDHYRDTLEPKMIHYKKFLAEVGSLTKFPVTGKYPSSCPELHHYTSIKELQGYSRTRGNYWCFTTEVHKDACEQALMKLMKHLKGQRILLRQDFRELDFGNCGHISPRLFRRTILYYGINSLTPIEYKSLDDRYMDFKGFNYRKFLDDVYEEVKIVAPCTASLTVDIFQDNSSESNNYFSRKVRQRILPELKVEYTILQVLNKVKMQVTEYDLYMHHFFEQYSPHKETMMSHDLFARALTTAGVTLTQPEMDVIFKYYGTPYRKGFVDYQLFLEAVYSSQYQLELEKAPLCIPIKSTPIKDGAFNFLTYAERRKLQVALQKLATRADIISREAFKEFDRFSFGTVSRQNLPRVLSYIGRSTEYLLTEEELNLVYKAFCRPRGSYTEMDYNVLTKVLKFIREMDETI